MPIHSQIPKYFFQDFLLKIEKRFFGSKQKTFKKYEKKRKQNAKKNFRPFQDLWPTCLVKTKVTIDVWWVISINDLFLNNSK